MTRSELIAAFRSIADDAAVPYLWSDADLYIYLEDAEKEAAARASLLVEETSATYSQIVLANNQSTYALNPLVLDVRRVSLNGQTLRKKSKAIMDADSDSWETETGVPIYYILGMQSIRVFPIPTTATGLGTMYLDVTRLPIAMATAGPEILPKYHFKLLDWVLHLAYSKHDPETYDPAKSISHGDRFTASFGEPQTANTQVQRLTEGPDRLCSRWI